MPSSTALFRTLLPAADWPRLGAAVQRMHAEGRIVQASGKADVTGASHLAARLLRRVLTLPEPGAGQAITVTIERNVAHERWSRRFRRSSMRSMLRAGTDGQLHERLGPVTLCFTLHRDDDAIEWQLQGVRLLGLPLPRALCGTVLSRSGMRGGRYAFDIDVRLPLVGRLVAYCGWLEIDHVA
ncbi:DUF4166 domain-containing protein [Rhodanobacter hydrolyticus]|uniref:DUF4166 domain-containing protein n=1 Tax=Rhodanobacter hydrolyticus TaxID=2250595 RepID=A0ABW8J9Q2_9GAMM